MRKTQLQLTKFAQKRSASDNVTTQIIEAPCNWRQYEWMFWKTHFCLENIDNSLPTRMVCICVTWNGQMSLSICRKERREKSNARASLAHSTPSSSVIFIAALLIMIMNGNEQMCAQCARYTIEWHSSSRLPVRVSVSDSGTGSQPASHSTKTLIRRNGDERSGNETDAKNYAGE